MKTIAKKVVNWMKEKEQRVIKMSDLLAKSAGRYPLIQNQEPIVWDLQK